MCVDDELLNTYLDGELQELEDPGPGTPRLLQRMSPETRTASRPSPESCRCCIAGFGNLCTTGSCSPIF